MFSISAVLAAESHRTVPIAAYPLSSPTLTLSQCCKAARWALFSLRILLSRTRYICVPLTRSVVKFRHSVQSPQTKKQKALRKLATAVVYNFLRMIQGEQTVSRKTTRNSREDVPEVEEKRARMMASQNKTPITILQELAAKIVRKIAKSQNCKVKLEKFIRIY